MLAEKAPLYGRRTGQCELKPFEYRTASLFFPNWPAEDRLIAYGILGGMPAYLSQFNPKASLTENIQQKILRKGTFLSEEVDFVLQTELRVHLLNVNGHPLRSAKLLSNSSTIG